MNGLRNNRTRKIEKKENRIHKLPYKRMRIKCGIKILESSSFDD